MIRALATSKHGSKVLLLGLSEMNVRKLKQGLPIHVLGEEVGLPGISVVIMYGETEDSMREQLDSLIGPETVERDLRKERKR